MLRDRLKNLTKPFHDELETKSIPQKIISKTITKDEYIHLLSVFYSILQPFEIELSNQSAKFASFGISINQRAKAHLLENDLTNLGVALPKTIKYSEQDFEHLVGAMYVFEGSTMGGIHLSRELALVDFAKDAHSYFTPYKQDTMQRWQEFCLFLDQIDKQSNFDGDTTILSACKTFLSLKKLVNI